MSPEPRGRRGPVRFAPGLAPVFAPVLALGALILAALLVRLVGLDFGLPVWEEPDAVIAMHVDKLRSGSDRPDRRWSDQEYPHLVAQLTRLLPAGPPVEGPDAPKTLAEHLAAASHTHLQVRLVVALLSVLAIPGTWWLARRFLPPAPALLAAAFTATSLLLMHFSQQGRPHAAAGGLFVLSVVASMRVARRGGVADLTLAGLAAGAAVGVLQTGVFVLPALAAGCLLRPGARGWRRVLDARLLIPLGLVALSIRLLYPFLFGQQLGQDFGTPELEGERITMAEHSVALEQFLHGGGFRVLALSLWNYDPVLLVLAVGSGLAWIGGRLGLGPAAVQSSAAEAPTGRAELLVALAFVLPYLLVVGMFEKTYERFAIPLLPFLAATAAWGLGALAARLGRAVYVGAALGLLLPALACGQLARLRSRPDTMDLTAAWVEANLEPPASLVVPAAGGFSVDLDLPLSRTDEQLTGLARKQHSPWTIYLARLSPEARPEPRWGLRWMVPRTPEENRLLREDYRAFVLALAPAYYVIQPFELRRDAERMVELTRLMRERGELVARFTPEGPDGRLEWPFFYQLSDHFNEPELADWPHFALRLFSAQAIGPYLEVYRLEQGR